MKLKPLADRVILKQFKAEEKTKSGLILAASAQEKPEMFEVVEVGSGRHGGRQRSEDDRGRG